MHSDEFILPTNVLRAAHASPRQNAYLVDSSKSRRTGFNNLSHSCFRWRVGVTKWLGGLSTTPQVGMTNWCFVSWLSLVDYARRFKKAPSQKQRSNGHLRNFSVENLFRALRVYICSEIRKNARKPRWWDKATTTGESKFYLSNLEHFAQAVIRGSSVTLVRSRCQQNCKWMDRRLSV